MRAQAVTALAMGARFAMTQLLIARGISPEFLGAPRRYLAPSGAVNAFPPRNSQFSCQFPRNSSLTAGELITVRPRAFPPPPAAFPAPALAARQSPRAPALTWPYDRGAGRVRACGHGPGGEYVSVNGYRATGRRPGINVRHASAAGHG